MNATTTTDRSAYIAHDTKLGELHEAAYRARNKLDSAQAREATIRRLNLAKLAEAETAVDQAYDSWLSALRAIGQHEANYTDWSRFFLVANVGGHIHRSFDCSTCYETTRYKSLPHLSGLTDADAVEDQGEGLCSVCFPDAPSEWTNGTLKSVRKAADVRAAEKAERAAKKLAKALRPNGEDLVVNPGERFPTRLSTIAAAKSWLTDAYDWNSGYPRTNSDGTVDDHHPSYPPAAVEQVAQALAARIGETVEDVKAAALKRAQKRVG